jgi:hypothetical protein
LTRWKAAEVREPIASRSITLINTAQRRPASGDDAADSALVKGRTAFELRRDITKEGALRRLGLR